MVSRSISLLHDSFVDIYVQASISATFFFHFQDLLHLLLLLFVSIFHPVYHLHCFSVSPFSFLMSFFFFLTSFFFLLSSFTKLRFIFSNTSFSTSNTSIFSSYSCLTSFPLLFYSSFIIIFTASSSCSSSISESPVKHYVYPYFFLIVPTFVFVLVKIYYRNILFWLYPTFILL